MRYFSIGLIVVICLAFGMASLGCKKSENGPRELGARKSAGGEGDGDMSARESHGLKRPGAEKKAPAEEKKGAIDGKDPAGGFPMKAAIADAAVGVERPTQPKVKDSGLPSGILTAGSFDDNLDPKVFLSLIGKMSQDSYLGDVPGKLRGQRLMVLVKDQSGKPVGNARVKLEAKGASAEMTTRSDGRAIFVLSWDRLPSDQPMTATVLPPFGGRTAAETIPPGKARWEIVLPDVQAPLPKFLDLAIVLDTTGSMSDELKHLQAEIRGIASAIRKKFPEVNQRYALVLYRDEGDDYVTRRFDFTSSLEEFHARLAKQSAGGGGDYPEAVHRAFEEAQQLRWQDNDTARVLFWVGDAPPHSQHVARTMTAADALRKNGVVIYPIACSGYDDSTEFLMRTCALLTGGQFLFLTDDSGVGNAHAEPRIPYYQVERLEKLIVRMVAGELSGRRVNAEPGDVIRTVGKKVN